MQTITFKLIISSLLVAILTTTAYTTFALQKTLSEVNAEFESSIEQFKESYLPSLEEAVWNFNDTQAQQIINGVTTSVYIKRIEVEALPYFEVEAGEMPSITEPSSFSLNREGKRIATIRIYLDKGIREQRIKEEIFEALYFLLVFFTLQTAAIFLAVRMSVLKGLQEISSSVENYSVNQLDSKIEFQSSKTYEIELIKDSINHLIERLQGEQTKTLQYQMKLEEESNYDSLTHLPNRKNCQFYLQQRIVKDLALGEIVYVIHIDFLNFKSINSLYGSHMGDQFLITAKHKLETILEENFYISRYGSDRFVVVNYNPFHRHEVELIVDLLKKELESPVALSQDVSDFSLNVSIGIVTFPHDFSSAEALLLASERMAKESRKLSRPVYYEKALDMEINERDQIRQSLTTALKKEEFSLNYQPIVNLSDGSIHGYEALIRWHSPELGFIPPDRFIEIAEDESLIIPIEEWVINTACRDISQLSVLNNLKIKIAINISYQHFISDRFIPNLQRAISKVDLHPEQIEIELTERVLAEDAYQVETKIQRLKQMGIKVSIDDFGTGFSALNYLKDFSFDTLKIDKSFVQSMLSNERNLALVKNIIRLAHDLDIEVIAEGIELEHQYQSLAKMRCNFGQGYLMSRPVPFKELNPTTTFSPSDK
ncbi:putative bifunctional diguanylate cyclase/phosphodiesterase [Neptuniibacter caesariensis]|uniref:Sensory box/GGDEF family protein n=1 Tax=Neptuniibacter caesariensis TaxID=207954 RepID=A0A7U8C4X4_NEPCE|nr:bifunctional diguanylate cyclase/phosphodiesterase [Neptuniibacter caesariensis]EAR60170.1 sensory box/GGDEF family protein [Oceanospirillum sp. MED92] [Neptuniibacter caesariensis]